MVIGAALFAAEACLGSSHSAVAESGYTARADRSARRAGAGRDKTQGENAGDRSVVADGKPTSAGDEVAPLREDGPLSQGPLSQAP